MDLFLSPHEIPAISGLDYRTNFITESQSNKLLKAVDAQPWQHTLKRRVQHYGYRYDYKARQILASDYLGALPDFIQPLIKQLVEKNIFKKTPDQVIVNEYLPGQGIAAHIDCTPCFGGIIASLSLGSAATMQLNKGDNKQDIYLEPKSLLLLQDEARYDWKHAIPTRKSDTIHGTKITRNRRISLTFRQVNNS